MTPDAELTLDLDIPEDVTVVTCRLTEGISKLTHARLEIASNEHLDLHGELEKAAVIDMAPIGFPARRWTLRVGHVDFTKITEGSLRYIVNLYPALWLLRFTTNTRKFRKMSAEDIISKILTEHQVAHRFELLRKTDTRNYCGQYRETNLDFVHRLLEWEGIYYSFEDDGTVVFADRSQSSEDTDQASFFELTEAEGAMQWGSVGLYSFKKGRRVASGAATVNDHNWKKPKLKLLRSAAAEEDPELEVYDYPTGYRREDQGERLSRLRLEALRIPAKYTEGSGNVSSFEPARCFTFGGLAGTRFEGEYLLTDVEHDYVNRKFQETEKGAEKEVNYRNHFSAIPKEIPFRPPLVTAHPHIAGCHTAMVRGPEGEEIHTDVHGRFRAQFHWDREAVGSDEDSRWLRNTQETATGMVLARVGWEQSIAYIDGDPDRPFGFSRNINGEMAAEYAQPVNRTRTSIKTPTYPGGGGFNEVRMEDLAGLQHMDWHAQRDMFTGVGMDRSEHIEGDEHKKVEDTYAWTVGNDQDFSIGGNYEVSVEKNYSLNVNEDRTKKVGGDEDFKITEVYAYTVAGNSKEEVTGNRKVLAAEKNGSITREIQKNIERKVGADWSVEGQGNLEVIVQDDLKETVGGSKTITVSDGGIGVRVGGVLDLHVKGDVIRDSGESMGYSAKRTKIEVANNATMHGGEKLAINGDRIVIECTQSLELRSQKLSLKLEPGKTTIEGTMKIQAGGNIKVTGNPDNLTQ